MEEIPELSVTQNRSETLRNVGTWTSNIGLGIVAVGDALIGVDTIGIRDIEPIVYNCTVAVGAITVMAGVAINCLGLTGSDSH